MKIIHSMIALKRKTNLDIQLPLTMKISLILFWLVAFQLHAVTSFAQKTRQPIHASNVSVEEVLNLIERHSDYVFLYNEKKIDTQRIVSVTNKQGNIPQILDKVFRGTQVKYSFLDQQIILSKKKAETEQFLTVKGLVKDNNNEPLIGVNVLVKGTTNGTITDYDGCFTIRLKPNDILLLSYTGYITQEIKVKDAQPLTIVLEENQVALNEVVVTALGIKKESKALSYNVQEIKSAQIVGVKDANFMNSLSGKIAGVQINTSSSGVGGAVKVVMRGTKSISGNNNALYVVDGVPLPTLNTVSQPGDIYTGMGQTGDGISMINPEDIQSMSVLSGAAAAALYGSDAANGVVMITTKKGQKNQFSVNYSNSTSFMDPFVMPEFQNTYGSNTGSFYSWGEKLASPSSYDPKDFFQTGWNENNSLSLAVGSEHGSTYVSVASTNARGIIHNNNLDRYNFSIRNTTDFLQDKLHLDVSAMYVKIKEQNLLAQGQYCNPLLPIYLFPRDEDISKYQAYERYNVERNFKTQYWPYGNMGLGMQNPYWITERNKFINHKNRFLISGGLTYDITPWMNIAARTKMDFNTAINESKYWASTDPILAGKFGGYYKDDVQTNQLYADVMLNVDKYFGDFSLTATLGASIKDVKYRYSRVGRDLQSVANLFSLNNLNLMLARMSQTDYHDQNQAVFATAQLGWKSKVYLDVTARNDWSSALANTKSKSIFYPSVGLSAILTELLPIKSSVLSFMKIRGSYSEVGNAPKRFISSVSYPLSKGTPVTSTYMPNENLKPERTKSWEIGMKTHLWGNKLKFDIAFYKSSTYNQLFNPTLSTTSGYSSFYVNAGQVDNKGIEASLHFQQDLGPVNWKTNFVYSINRNKIVKLLPEYTMPNGEVVSLKTMDMGGVGNAKTMLTEGGSMGDLYVTTLKTDEHGYIDVDYTAKTVSPDPNTYVYAGNTNPKYTLSWGNSFSWKGITLNCLIRARVGGVGFSMTQALMDAFGVSKTSADARDNGGALVNGFRIPAQAYYQTVGQSVGSQYVYSATNVRLAELSVGYDVPIHRYVRFIKNMHVAFTGRNLFMFYNKCPYDPELTASTGTYFQGMDYFMQPSLRNLGFSVKLNF